MARLRSQGAGLRPACRHQEGRNETQATVPEETERFMWIVAVKCDRIRWSSAVGFLVKCRQIVGQVYQILQARSRTSKLAVLRDACQPHENPRKAILFRCGPDSRPATVASNQCCGAACQWEPGPRNRLTSPGGLRVQCGPAAQRPSGPAAQRPSGPAAQRPSGPAAQRPSGPAAQRPSGPAALPLPA